MADDRLKYGIKFDLEKAVEEASNDWDKYAKKLEKALEKRPLKVKIGFDLDKKLDTLDDVKKKLSELKIEPITPENKTALRELIKELKELAKIMEKVSCLKGIELPELQASKAAKMRKEVEQADAKLAMQQERTRQAQERLTLAQKRAEEQAHKTGRAYGEQSSYLKNLIRQMVAYWSIDKVTSFITSVKDITAEFELQRVSLGAIIQDQTRANQLFAEIKAFAVKSPIKLLDLTKYVKQVAAYKVGTEELFETTKRLADVSVGLGVDMSRLVLAYGQVKAASYLRAAEIRQFTEAGIPMLELLAEKFTQLQGSAVSTEEVMDKVSKRMVDFGMVKQIFEDMTNAGGMFYEMQEKQGNTLFGMWAKLGDAAAIMYDEIGNTEIVNSGMKAAIQAMSDLMKNWRELARIAAIISVGFVGVKVAGVILKMMKVDTLAAAKATKDYERAQNTLNAAQANGNKLSAILAQRTMAVASANKAAALSTSFFGTALNRLKALFISNWVTLLLSAIALLAERLYSAYENAHKLEKELNNIKTAATTEADQSVMNFEALADAALKASDGSRQQREALQELENTYKNIIATDELKIEKLRALRGNYESLTVAIRNYIAQQKLQEGVNTIIENYADKIKGYHQKISGILKEGIRYWEDTGRKDDYYRPILEEKRIKLSDRQIKRIGANIENMARSTSKKWNEIWQEAFAMEGIDVSKLRFGSLPQDFFVNESRLVKTIRDEKQAIKDLSEEMEEQFPLMGQYADDWKKVNERIDNIIVKGAKVGTFTYDQAIINASIQQYKGFLKGVLGNAWDESFATIEEYVGKNGDKMSTLFIEKMMAPEYWDKLTVAQQQAILIVKKEYEGLIPTDPLISSVRSCRTFQLYTECRWM